MTGPDFTFEDRLMTRGATRIAGVDEVGRGPLAGPVMAAAVILDPARIPDGLNDSKKLSPRKREMIAEEINQTATVAIGSASVEEIDQINILRAAHLAMMRALHALEPAADTALIDGNMLPRDIRIPAHCLIKGDARSLSIAAASIVAKVARDKIMVDLAQQHPGYGWERNMGYPTAEHRARLESHGATPHHRRSFKTVHNIL